MHGTVNPARPPRRCHATPAALCRATMAVWHMQRSGRAAAGVARARTVLGMSEAVLYSHLQYMKGLHASSGRSERFSVRKNVRLEFTTAVHSHTVLQRWIPVSSVTV